MTLEETIADAIKDKAWVSYSIVSIGGNTSIRYAAVVELAAAAVREWLLTPPTLPEIDAALDEWDGMPDCVESVIAAFLSVRAEK